MRFDLLARSSEKGPRAYDPPGLPGFFLGHNQPIAWGATTTHPDVQDLYIEHINDRDEAAHNGVWEQLRMVSEVIKVNGQPDVPIQVRISRHGPLILDVIAGTGAALAFRWTALDEEDHTLAAFLDWTPLLSPNDSNLLARWQRVEYLPMRFEQAIAVAWCWSHNDRGNRLSYRFEEGAIAFTHTAALRLGSRATHTLRNRQSAALLRNLHCSHRSIAATQFQ